MVNAQLVLSPLNGKRLIAKAVVETPEFIKAKQEGLIVLSLGTTNALIYQELTQKAVSPHKFAAGVVAEYLGVSDSKTRLAPLVLERGRVISASWQEVLANMDNKSLFIKGANAYDNQGLAGVLVGGEGGGTIGQAIGALTVRKVPLMVPVGVEKRIPSVLESARILGEPSVKTKNMVVGMIVVTNGILVDEIEAFRILFGLEATLLASGGLPGFEGSAVFNIKGEEASVNKALDLTDTFRD